MTSPTGTKKKKRDKKSAGFTLIELTLVVILVLVLLGLSMPLLKKTSANLIVTDSAFTISKLMNYGQEKAILEKKNFKLVINTQNGTYRLLEGFIFDNTLSYKKTSGRFGRSFALPRGIRFEGSAKEITFYPDGHCDEARIKVLDASGQGYAITTKGFGRFVEVKETIER